MHLQQLTKCQSTTLIALLSHFHDARIQVLSAGRIREVLTRPQTLKTGWCAAKASVLREVAVAWMIR